MRQHGGLNVANRGVLCRTEDSHAQEEGAERQQGPVVDDAVQKPPPARDVPDVVEGPFDSRQQSTAPDYPLTPESPRVRLCFIRI